MGQESCLTIIRNFYPEVSKDLLEKKKVPVQKEFDIEPFLKKPLPVTNLYRVWIVCRWSTEASSDQAEYLGFKSFMSRNAEISYIPVTKIGYLPVIPESPSNPAVVAESIREFQKTARALGLPYTVVTSDLAIVEIVQSLRSYDKDEFSDVIVRLGGLHCMMNYLGALGYVMKATGLDEVLSEASVLKPGTAIKILSGKPYYKAFMAHLMLAEAVSSLHWEAFQDFLLEQGDESVIELNQQIAELASSLKENGEEREQLMKELESKIAEIQPWTEKFDESRKFSLTHRFWRQYEKLVMVLLQFYCSERVGDWPGHLIGLANMVPLFVVAGHYKYASCSIEYLNDMQKLPEEVETAFRLGFFNVKRKPGNFNAIAPDHATESTINLDAKSSGGLKGITTKQSAISKWTLTMPFCAAVSADFL